MLGGTLIEGGCGRDIFAPIRYNFSSLFAHECGNNIGMHNFISHTYSYFWSFVCDVTMIYLFFSPSTFNNRKTPIIDASMIEHQTTTTTTATTTAQIPNVCRSSFLPLPRSQQCCDPKKMSKAT